jgi:hypothetical protein
LISRTEFQIQADHLPRVYRYADDCVVLRFGMECRILIFANKEKGITVELIEQALAKPEQIAREVEDT